jgi:hypothetical protein
VPQPRLVNTRLLYDTVMAAERFGTSKKEKNAFPAKKWFPAKKGFSS